MRAGVSNLLTNSVNAFDKLCLPLQHAGNGFLNHLRGGFTLAGGKLVELGLHVRFKLHFHRFVSCLSFQPSGYRDLCHVQSMGVGLAGRPETYCMRNGSNAQAERSALCYPLDRYIWSLRLYLI